ncbi:MAG: transposase [Chloroflexi bacterium]|nr:transposase [Chloroflexota bacterium]
MAAPHPPYSPECRAGAVELARTSGKSIPVLARELGIADQSLRKWVRPAGRCQHRPAGRPDPRRARRVVAVTA